MSSQSTLERLARTWLPVEPGVGPSGPRIFIAGGQLTGKSTTSAHIARKLGVRHLSGGAVVREMAAEADLTVEAMSLRLRDDPRADVRLDRGLLSAAAREPAVVECRLAGWLGCALRLRALLPVTTVLLQCQPTELALRWVQREIDGEQATRCRGEVRGSAPWLDFQTAVEGVVRLLPRRLRPHPGSVDAAIRRDSDDRARLRQLYGVDFDDGDVFDLVIDGDSRTPEQVADAVCRAAPSRSWGASVGRQVPAR